MAWGIPPSIRMVSPGMHRGISASRPASREYPVRGTALPTRAGHVRLEAVVDAGFFAVHGVAAEDVPALGLAVLALEQPQGRRLVGMHLQSQALGAVDELGQHAEGGLRCAFAEIALRIAFQHRFRVTSVPRRWLMPSSGNCSPSGVAGGDGGKYPLFGEMPVLARWSHRAGRPASGLPDRCATPGGCPAGTGICCRFINPP